MVIYGVDLDSEGRCRHYHTACDVVALKCSKCQEYFACYQCHNQLRNHPFESVSRSIKRDFVLIVTMPLIQSVSYMRLFIFQRSRL